MLKRCWYRTYRVAGEPFASGGRGKLYRVLDPPGLVYKELAGTALPGTAQIKLLVDLGRRAAAARLVPGENQLASINWPVDAEPAPGDLVRGVILPAIAEQFYRPETGSLRTFNDLYLRRAKPPAAAGRLAVLLQAAELVGYLNGLGLVHGDLSAGNLAWCVRDVKAQVYLFDTDGIVAQGTRPADPNMTAGWTDPRITDRLIRWPDQASNRWAVAKLIYCGALLTPGEIRRDAAGRWPGPAAIPGELPERLAVLLRRALGNPQLSRARPEPREFVSALYDSYFPRGLPDRAAAARLDAAIGYPPSPGRPALPSGGRPARPRRSWSHLTGKWWRPAA